MIQVRERRTERGSDQPRPPAARALHVLELVDAALGVALADLAQSLVLVAPLAHVLTMDLVHGGLHGLVARLR